MLPVWVLFEFEWHFIKYISRKLLLNEIAINIQIAAYVDENDHNLSSE